MKTREKQLENKDFRKAVKACLISVGAEPTVGEFLRFEKAFPIGINWRRWARSLNVKTVRCYKLDIDGERLRWSENNKPIIVNITAKRLAMGRGFQPVDEN